MLRLEQRRAAVENIEPPEDGPVGLLYHSGESAHCAVVRVVASWPRSI